MTDTLYETQMPSTRAAREELLDAIMSITEKANIDLILDKFEYRLVLDEAITNAMEHGNQWDPQKKLYIAVRKPNDKELKVTIRDQGIGFNSQLIPSILEKTEKASYRGRGIYIIRNFCKVCWNNIGNEVTLSLSLKGS